MAVKQKIAINPAELDSHAAQELYLYAVNDGSLYRQQILPIYKNLITKKARGIYKTESAVKLAMYLMENAAKKYHREFGSPGDKWSDMFNVPTRREAARDFIDRFESEAKLGNYDEYLPVKQKIAINPAELDSHAAQELYLYAVNDGSLYRQQILPIYKNLITKKARGIYKTESAVKLAMYLMENAAKKYHREFGSPGDKWSDMFNVPTRREAARDFIDRFESEAKLGNYDEYLPKKYQGSKRNGAASVNPSQTYYTLHVADRPHVTRKFDTKLEAVKAVPELQSEYPGEDISLTRMTYSKHSGFAKFFVKRFRGGKRNGAASVNPRTRLKKSKGHIGFSGDRETEFFVRGDSIMRAPVSSPVMTDGYRSGRFEAMDTAWHREYVLNVFAQNRKKGLNPAGKRNGAASVNPGKLYYVVRYIARSSQPVEIVSKTFTNKADAQKALTVIQRNNKISNATFSIGDQWDDADGRREISILRGRNPVKRNATAAEFRSTQSNKLRELAKLFQGEANGQKRRVLESDYTPKDKYRLGYLVQIKIKDGGKTIPIDFDGESLLSADLKNNLWVAGKDAVIGNVKRPVQGQLKYLGEVVQVDYVTAKKHIEDGKTVRFYHKLGEVTREKPNLFMDHDGFPIFVGGGYDIWDVGIVN